MTYTTWRRALAYGESKALRLLHNAGRPPCPPMICEFSEYLYVARRAAEKVRSQRYRERKGAA